MVGVPGRSKGCNTCRQRRVKCTEEKPICSRCTRGGFTCRGYTRETVWHNLMAEPSARAGPTHAAGGSLIVVDRRKPEVQDKAKTAAQAEMSLLSPQISLDAFEEDFCFAYIFSNFVWRGYGASWLLQSSQGLLGQLAFDSVRALAQISFGTSQKSRQTEIQGRIKYGKALRCMIERLVNGQKSNLQELVIPILVLLMHTATLTNQAAAMFHLQGMTQILCACGPKVFQHQPLRDAFEAARATIVVASLVTRKRVFLDNPAWYTEPYALAPRSKAPQSYLLDILTSVPGLLEDVQKLERLKATCSRTFFAEHMHMQAYATGRYPSNPAMANVTDASLGDVATEQSNLIKRVMSQLESLFLWRMHWQVAFGSDVCAESVIQSLSTEYPIYRPSNDPASSRGGRLQFSRPGAATDISLYNAVLMWLLALIEKLEPLRAKSIVQNCANQAMISLTDAEFAFTSGPEIWLTDAPPFEPLRAIGATTSVRDAALEICSVFEWQSCNHASNRETNFVYMFPIGLALCVLDVEPKTRGWIRTMLDANALTRGYGAGHHVELGSAEYGSIIDRLSLMDSVDNENVVDLGLETGTLHQLQKFGWYITRELPDGNARLSNGQDKTSVGQRSHQTEEPPSPNVVHLLLLRGRMDVSF